MRVRHQVPPEPKVEELEALDKADLYDLAYGLVLKQEGAVERCVEFILAETKGNWHGRARAMMCRRLKHCDVNAEQSRQLVSCISRRLTTGDFAEQFYDQLRLAMHLDQKSTFDIAQTCLASPKEHVRRFAAWILKHNVALGSTDSQREG